MTTHRDLTTPDLRPCPFCGGAAEFVSPSDLACFVMCESCGVCTSEHRAEAEAIAAWNRRPRTFTAAEVAEAMRGWGDAYAAFVGAFDTPAARRKQSDEYANDARDRLRDFHERITHWLRENELERTP
jgi:Lar family restriction alleviation protein